MGRKFFEKNMQKSLQGIERGITFAPATRKNGDAKTPRGVAKEIIESMVKTSKDKQQRRSKYGS